MSVVVNYGHSCGLHTQPYCDSHTALDDCATAYRGAKAAAASKLATMKAIVPSPSLGKRRRKQLVLLKEPVRLKGTKRENRRASRCKYLLRQVDRLTTHSPLIVPFQGKRGGCAAPRSPVLAAVSLFFTWPPAGNKTGIRKCR